MRTEYSRVHMCITYGTCSARGIGARSSPEYKSCGIAYLRTQGARGTPLLKAQRTFKGRAEHTEHVTWLRVGESGGEIA